MNIHHPCHKKVEISVSLDENKRESDAFRQRAESAEELVGKLENDLASAIGGGGLRTEELSTLDMLRKSSDEAPSADLNIMSSEASLVPILTSQRNRLHDKVSQMEEMLAFEKQKQMAVQTEIEKVRSDNTKLHERIRFLQGASNKSSSVMIEEDERKFASSDRSTRMQIHDRATLNIGRAILQNSKNRMIFFFYLLILHVLIMLVLYKYAFDQATIRDQETECEYNFSQHMLHNHKEH